MVSAHSLRMAPFAVRLAFTLVLSLACAGGALAHPFHASYAELSWSAPGDQLQVALRVIPEDLETALSREAGGRVLLDPEDPPASLIEAYLGRRFQVSAGGGEPAPVAFLGLDIAYDETWLYFTLPVARAAASLTLRNTLLFDVAEAQSNRVRALWAPEAPVLVFTAGEPWQPLPVHR